MTPAVSTTPRTPRIGPADGEGAPEDPNYAAEAAELANSLFEGLSDFDSEGSGVEPPAEQVGEASSEPAGSPTTPEIQAPVAPVVTTQDATQQTTEPPAQQQPAVQPAAPVVAAPAATGADGQAAQPVPATPAQPVEAPAQGVGYIQEVRKALDAGRESYTKALAEHYAMSEEEASAVLTEPEKVLPQLAARVHLEVVQNVLGTIAGVLPGVVLGVQQAQVQHKQLEDQFFTAWPQLDRQADMGTVMSLAQAWRAANPTASAEEMVKNVGAMAIVKLGKLPAAPPAQQVAPAVTGQPAYRPAVGAPSPVQPAQVDNNPWGEMAELLNE